jgi:hypothetical protein
LQYSRKHSFGADEHVDEEQLQAESQTGKNQDAVKSVVSTVPSFSKLAPETHVNADEVDESVAAPAGATFWPASL